MNGPERRGSERGQEAARPSTWPWGHLSSLEAGRTQAVGSEPASRPKKSLSTSSCGLQSPPTSARKSYKALELRSGPGLLDGLGQGWQISGQPAAAFGAFCPCCRIGMCQGCPAARTAGPATRRQWADAKPADPRRLQRKPPAEDGKCRTMRPVVIPGAGVTGACPKTVSCRV